MKLTQRFDGLSDLYKFECLSCAKSNFEQCRPAIRHTADVYRKQAKACRELASQARCEDRTFWLRLSDDWLKLAHDADERIR
jgi:hypothetical protein